MSHADFETFFTGPALLYLKQSIQMALEEDGADLTSLALFGGGSDLAPGTLTGAYAAACEKSSNIRQIQAIIKAKEETPLAGLPIIPLVLQATVAAMKICSSSSGAERSQGRDYNGFNALPGGLVWQALAEEGALLQPGRLVAKISGPAYLVLKAERVILNFITHLSGIAKLTRTYVQALKGGNTRLLDTRKTLPGLRYPEKYAVTVGGGLNHRKNLEEMLMLKDNHIDASGGITKAVGMLRKAYNPCPPIEVECRNLDEVREAVSLGVQRIMLDNMLSAPPFHADSFNLLQEALKLIPAGIESELSGGISLESLPLIAALRPGPDFVSVGRLTHSAPSSDFSMIIDFNQ